MKIATISFPRMHKETAEKRDFLPTLFGKIGRMSDVKILVERGYGSAMGYTEKDYLSMNPALAFSDSPEELYQQDMVIVVRAPDEDMIKTMKRGTILFSMLHYDTRPVRNRILRKAGIHCYSMDALKDDEGHRLFVNFTGTSFSAVRVAMQEFKREHSRLPSRSGGILKTAVVGCGQVGQTAIRAFQKFGDTEYASTGFPGMLITALPRSVIGNKGEMESILAKTDILVDASGRKDPSEIILDNRMLGLLPEHSIILDIAADPYNAEADPPSVKAFEGVPYGTLENYVIRENDPVYESIPLFVDTTNRRLCISCNAWPGFEPERCMKRYENQLMPFLRVILGKDPSAISETGDSIFERALAKATLSHFITRSNSKGA